LHEFFRVEKAYPLDKIRDHVLNKIQVYIGFIFLIAGYAIQIWATLLREKTEETASSPVGPNLLFVFLILVASVIFLTVILKIVQFSWTRWTFKHLMIDFFRDHDWELVKNIDVAKQIGYLLKIPKIRDESIEDYVKRLKETLHIPAENGIAPPPKPDRNDTRRTSAKSLPPAEQLHPATPPRIG
jgi:hypothetical protein